jgi:hypothetical protein
LLEGAISTDYNYSRLRHTKETIKTIMLKHVKKSMFYSETSKGGKC